LLHPALKARNGEPIEHGGVKSRIGLISFPDGRTLDPNSIQRQCLLEADPFRLHRAHIQEQLEVAVAEEEYKLDPE
jgi:hypothetical protein